MKKEPLSIITVKTILAVIIFTGVGTIIVGGGWLIGKQGKVSNGELSKSTVKETKEIASDDELIEQISEEKDESVDYLGCSEKNPPTIYFDKAGSALNLCGKKTGFRAYEFKKENIILFQTAEWNEEESEHYYSLKTISTVSPYKVKTLVSKRYMSINLNLDNFDSTSDLYFKEEEASGPGDIYKLFIFSPKTQEFMIVENIHHGYSGPYSLFLYSSASKNEFAAEKRSRESHTGDILLSNDNDIEIIINKKTFTKKEVDEGKADSIKDIFDYYFLPIAVSARKKDDSEKIKEMYGKFFPKRVPYFNYDYYKEEAENLVENPVGFFDFEKNEFVRF